MNKPNNVVHLNLSKAQAGTISERPTNFRYAPSKGKRYTQKLDGKRPFKRPWYFLIGTPIDGGDEGILGSARTVLELSKIGMLYEAGNTWINLRMLKGKHLGCGPCKDLKDTFTLRGGPLY